MIPYCLPTYDWRPSFSPSSATLSCNTYDKHRSRITVLNPNYVPPGGGDPGTPIASNDGLFIRSVDQSTQANNISIEHTGTTFNVYVSDVLVRSFPIGVGAGTYAQLRSMISGTFTAPFDKPDPTIEMPPFQFDIYDVIRDSEDDLSGLFVFAKINLADGDGPPLVAPDLVNVHTGPTRAMVIISTYEDIRGVSVTPPPGERVSQWDGIDWISYCNLVQGICPGDGNC